MKTSQVAHLTGDFNVPSESGENNFDSFQLDDTTPPYGHYSVDSTQELSSPGYNNQTKGSTGSEILSLEPGTCFESGNDPNLKRVKSDYDQNVNKTQHVDSKCFIVYFYQDILNTILFFILSLR